MHPEPLWLAESQVVRINQRLAAGTGVAHVVCDFDRLARAMAQPRVRWASGDHDMVALAGSLLLGIGRDRPFGQTNAGTALAAAAIFLRFNGYAFVAPDGEPLGTFVARSLADAIPESVFLRTLRQCAMKTTAWEKFKRAQAARERT